MRFLPVLLFLCAPALADDIFAKQGSAPMVTDVIVLEDTGEKVRYLDKRLKERALSKSMVGRVVKKRCVVHDYKDKEAAAKSGDDFMALAAWAKGKKFHKDVIRLIQEKALAADPNHEGANTALGRVQYKGEWMTPAQKTQREKDDADADKRASGLVEYKGAWVTPEDKARMEKGLVKHNGEWMTADEAKIAQGFVKFNGEWVRKEDLEIAKLMGPAKKDTGLGDKLKLVQTKNCAVMGDLPEAQLKQLAGAMEKLFAEWNRVFPDAKGSDLLQGKYRLYVFKKSRPYQKLVKAKYKREKVELEWSKRRAKEEEARMRARLKETSFWEFQPYAASSHVQMPDPFEGLKSHCIHFAANVLANRYSRQRFPTWWLNEGIAYYFEKKVTGAIQTFNVDVGGGGGYANEGAADGDGKNPWIDAASWNQLLTGLVRTGRDPKLDKLKGKQLYGTKNRMDHRDIAKAASVVRFLILDNSKKFAAFVKDAKNGPGATDIEREVGAMIKHYGHYSKVDAAWKKYALNGFRLAR